MVSLAVGCSTLFVVTVYISGGESYDASVGKPKKQDQTEHDVSVYFRPMLGKRAKYFIPRLGKREEEEDAHKLSWNADRAVGTGAKFHETDYSRDEPEVQHPLMFRWYTPRLGRRSSYFTPRLGKRAGFYTPRLGKQEAEDYSPCTLGDTDEDDQAECEFARERRKEKEDKTWKVIGMFNPRLGRSVASEMPDEDLRDLNNFSFDPEKE